MGWRHTSRVAALLAALAAPAALVAGSPADARAEAPAVDPQALFAQLNYSVVLRNARLVVLSSSYPVLRHDQGRRRIEITRGFLDKFPEEDLLAAALAHELSHLQLRVRGAPNTTKIETLSDEEGAFLLARVGRDPAALTRFLQAAPERLGQSHPNARDAAARVEHLQAFTKDIDELRRRFEQARIAMGFGEYEIARTLLLPLAERLPVNPEVHTNLGLAWLGSYYQAHGMARATFTGLQGLQRAPEATVQLPVGQIAAALGRGFPLAPDLPVDGQRVGKEVPPALVRAHAVLTLAQRQLPSEPRTLINLFQAELELATWDRARATRLASLKRSLEIGAARWSTPDAALAWLHLGLYRYLLGDEGAERPKRVERALDAFQKAADAGNPLGTWNKALLLTLDPDLAERRAEGSALLTTATSPLGSGYVQLTTDAIEVATVVELLRGETPDGVVRHTLAEYTAAVLPGGLNALVREGYGAWVAIPEEAEREAATAAAWQPPAIVVLEPPLHHPFAIETQQVRVRARLACDELGSLAPPSGRPGGARCGSVVAVRLPEPAVEAP